METQKIKETLPVTRTLRATVTEDLLAVRVGSGTLRVLGTPVRTGGAGTGWPVL